MRPRDAYIRTIASITAMGRGSSPAAINRMAISSLEQAAKCRIWPRTARLERCSYRFSQASIDVEFLLI
jgi:hypothetical protein